MSEADRAKSPLVVNGWTLFAHPLFLGQLEKLIDEVERARARDHAGYIHKKSTKLLAAIAKLAFEIIPQEPSRTEYRQGSTLGSDYKHWFRAKFYQQYRLFFRYEAKAKIIVFAWVNDEETKRAYESHDDAYRTFRRMLSKGNPPDEWSQLLAQAKASSPRLKQSEARLKAVD